MPLGPGSNRAGVPPSGKSQSCFTSLELGWDSDQEQHPSGAPEPPHQPRCCFCFQWHLPGFTGHREKAREMTKGGTNSFWQVEEGTRAYLLLRSDSSPDTSAMCPGSTAEHPWKPSATLTCWSTQNHPRGPTGQRLLLNAPSTSQHQPPTSWLLSVGWYLHI